LNFIRIFRVVSLFNYQGSLLSALRRQHLISYHIATALSTTFLNFFNFLFFSKNSNGEGGI
ncbi:MAG: hypothetical protein ACOCNC_09480, partial [Acetivibrio ethanolgignens]